MSRVRRYGKSVAVQTGGPDAVEPDNLEETKRFAINALTNHFVELARVLSSRGVELDVMTYDAGSTIEEDRIVYWWACDGRQKRNLLSRLVWAARL